MNPNELQNGASKFCPNYDELMQNNSEISFNEESSSSSDNSFTESELSNHKSVSSISTQNNTLLNPLFLLKDNPLQIKKNRTILEVNEETEEESEVKEENKSLKTEESAITYKDDTIISGYILLIVIIIPLIEKVDEEINNKFQLYELDPHTCSLKEQYKRIGGNIFHFRSMPRDPATSEIQRGHQSKNNNLLSPGNNNYIRKMNTPSSYQLSTETLSKSSRYSIISRQNSIGNENDISIELLLYVYNL